MRELLFAAVELLPLLPFFVIMLLGFGLYGDYRKENQARQMTRSVYRSKRVKK